MSALGRGAALSSLRVQRELSERIQWSSKDGGGEKETTGVSRWDLPEGC